MTLCDFRNDREDGERQSGVGGALAEDELSVGNCLRQMHLVPP